MVGNRNLTKSVNLGTAWLGLALGIMVIIANSFSVFFDSVASEFDWSRAQMSLAFSLFMLAATAALPFVGRVVDLYGSRNVIIAAVIVFACGTLALKYWVFTLWQFYVTFIAIGIVAGGTSTVPYFKVITQSFKSKRGLALGLANSGTSAGALTFPYLAHLLIEGGGWRDAYLTIGIGVMIITVPLVLAGLNEKKFDQSHSLTDAEVSTATRIADNVSVSEAIRSKPFWIIGAAFFCAATALIGYLIHMVPLLTDRGLSLRTAAIGASTFGIAQLFGRIAAGFLLDRFIAAHVAAALWIIATLTFLFLSSGATGNVLLVTAALLGLAWGGEGDVLAYLVCRYFGLQFFGSIYGLLLTIHLLGGAAGPYLVGIGLDIFGSYTEMLVIMAAISTFAVILILSLGRYPSASIQNFAEQV